MDNFKQNITLHYDDKLKQFYKDFAKDYLVYLGNPKPTFRHLNEMQFILSQVWIQRTICIDGRLTYREKQCLYLSAFGKTLKQIATYFDISIRQVERLRNSIFEKLNTKNIAQSVLQGIRFGNMPPPDFPEGG